MDQHIAIKGELDLATAPDLLRRLDEAIDGHQGRIVEVDFSGVTFIDSTGLGVLVACRKRARAAGGDLAVRNVRPAVRPVFEISGLDKVLLESV